MRRRTPRSAREPRSVEIEMMFSEETTCRGRPGARHQRQAILAMAIFLIAANPAFPAEDPTLAPDGAASGLAVEDFSPSDQQLGELIAALLDGNPRIRAAWAGAQSRFEQVPQARSLADPQLSYRYFARTPETRVGPAEHVLEFSQQIPWRKKRSLQADRAESLASAASWQVQDLERALVAVLKAAYFEAAYLQEAITVNAEEQELLRRFESIALTRYATGEGIQQHVVKVQTDVSRLEDQKTNLRERLDIILRRIAALIGQPESGLGLEPIRLLIPSTDVDRADLERRAVAEHPMVRAFLQRIEADEHWSRRRTLESRPDFRLGVGYTFVGDRDDPAGMAFPPEDNGKDSIALSVGISIPVYRGRIRAGVAEAQVSLRANQDSLQGVQNQLRYDIQEASLRLESIGDRGRLYGDAIIPQAEESLASAEAAYTTNRLSFLDLLDAERILFQARLAYHRLVSDYWVAAADLERALGRPFPAKGFQTEEPHS